MQIEPVLALFLVLLLVAFLVALLVAFLVALLVAFLVALLVAFLVALLVVVLVENVRDVYIQILYAAVYRIRSSCELFIQTSEKKHF